MDRKIECLLCSLEVDPKNMLQHMAGHIIEKEVGGVNIQALPFPCLFKTRIGLLHPGVLCQYAMVFR